MPSHNNRTMSVPPDNEIYTIIHRAVHCKPDEVANICRDLQVCIDSGANLNRCEYAWIVPLWTAIRDHVPTDVIRVLYENNPAAKYIRGMASSFSNSEYRSVDHMLTFELFLSKWFGRYFRNMFDQDIIHIEYILKVLDVLEMTEADVDWDAYLKLGLCD